jgi:hypothetical protein
MHIYGLLSVFICFLIPVVLCECSWGTSRIVRNVFHQELEPVFSHHSVTVPDTCPLSAEHDVFATHEQQKHSESPGKWTCGFCGKSFYDEKYLDRHFETRHGDYIPKGEHVTCLADYCDIFRCDVITGRIKPHFWDIALCKETEMARLFIRCQNILEQCIPKHVDGDQRTSLIEALNKTLCSYLTCDMFWYSPNEEIPRRRTVLYIIAAVFIIFGMFIYYFIAYTHFFTDESLLDGSRHHSSRRNSAYHRQWSDERVRRRTVNYHGQS